MLVDGAHAPGQLPLDIDAIGATWYVGNNHKWICAPKASGFLVTRTELAPLVASHGSNPMFIPQNRLHAELDWDAWERPPVFEWLGGHVAEGELRRVFNLGIGWCAVVRDVTPAEPVIGWIA